jgi:hypothetical protein
VLLAGLWLSGYFYAELPAVSVLLAFSPVLALVRSTISLDRSAVPAFKDGVIIIVVASRGHRHPLLSTPDR